MNSILDATPFPWDDPSAPELHATLLRLHPKAHEALLIAQMAGLSQADFDSGQEPKYLWAAILSKAGANGLTRQLATTVHKGLNASNPALPLFDRLLGMSGDASDDLAPAVLPREYVVHDYVLLDGRQGLIGRRNELEMLNEWALGRRAGDPRVFSLIGIGGLGKSALSWHWFSKESNQHREDAFAGRMWWSFYDIAATYESFITHLHAYVNGHPVARSESIKIDSKEIDIFDTLNRQNFLVVLDGFERLLRHFGGVAAPYQADDKLHEWEQKHTGRQTVVIRAGRFLRKLASLRCSRILISSRLHPAILEDELDLPIRGVDRLDLGGLHDDDVIAFWRTIGAGEGNGVAGDPGLILAHSNLLENHPGMLHIFARRVYRDPLAGRNFDKWLAQHPNFDLLSIDPATARSYVMRASWDDIADVERRVLQVVAAFRAGCDFLTLRNIAFAPDSTIPLTGDSELHETLSRLQEYGYLGSDNRGEVAKYDLHPVVRNAVWNDMDSAHRNYVDAQLEAHFRDRVYIGAQDLTSARDVQYAIELACILLRSGRNPEAFELVASRLLAPLSSQSGGKRELCRILNEITTDWSIPAEDAKVEWEHIAYAYYAYGDLRRAAEYHDLHNRKCGLPQCVVTECEAFMELGQLKRAWAGLCRVARAQGLSYCAPIVFPVVARLCELLGNREAASALLVDAESGRRSVSLFVEQTATKRAFLWSSKLRTLPIDAAFASRDFAAAEAAIGELIASSQEHADRAGEGEAQYRLAELMLNLGDPEDHVEEVLQQALSAAQDDDATDIEIRCYLMLGQLERRRGQVPIAEKYLHAALRQADSLGFRLLATDAMCELAELYHSCGVTATASDYAKRAYESSLCDGPPFVYSGGMARATKTMENLSLNTRRRGVVLKAPLKFEDPFSLEWHHKSRWVELAEEDAFGLQSLSGSPAEFLLFLVGHGICSDSDSYNEPEDRPRCRVSDYLFRHTNPTLQRLGDRCRQVVGTGDLESIRQSLHSPAANERRVAWVSLNDEAVRKSVAEDDIRRGLRLTLEAGDPGEMETILRHIVVLLQSQSETREIIHMAMVSESLRLGEAADEAIAKLDSAVAVPLLRGLLGHERADVRRRALVGLEQFGPAAALAVGDVVGLLRDEDDGVRAVAIGAAARLGALAPEHAPLLIEVIAAESRSLGQEAIDVIAAEALSPGEAAAWAIGRIDAGVAVPLLRGLLGHERADVRRRALVGLEQFGPAAALAVGDVVGLLRDEDDGVRAVAIGAAARLGALAPEHAPLLIEAIAAESRSLGEAAAWAIGKLDAGVAVPALRGLLGHERAAVRRHALVGLGQFGPAAAQAADEVSRLVDDKDEQVQWQARTTLNSLNQSSEIN